MTRIQYDLPTLNRWAITVQPTEVFLEWANSLPDTTSEMTLADMRIEAHIYLIPERLHDDDWEKQLRKHFAVIFEHELWGWCTDPEFWPEKRTYGEFRKWFEVEFHSMVLELGDGDVEVE